jgi:hypothetical protein
VHGAAMRASAARGAYNVIVEGEELARRLTSDLLAVGHDRHIIVRFSPEVLPTEPDRAGEPSPEEVAQFRSRLARDNYGFRRVEILSGNIGLIRLDLFAPPEFAADTYLAAMGFVAETEALIIDLRESRTGWRRPEPRHAHAHRLLRAADAPDRHYVEGRADASALDARRLPRPPLPAPADLPADEPANILWRRGVHIRSAAPEARAGGG